MQRVYGLVEDALVHRVDGDASVMGVSRSKWLGLAIEAFLNRNGEGFTGDKRDQSGVITGDNRVFTGDAGDDHNKEIAHLKEIIAIKDGEIQHLRYLTNDLRSLADNMATKIPTPPALTQMTEEERAECRHHWWQFWKKGQAASTS